MVVEAFSAPRVTVWYVDEGGPRTGDAGLWPSLRADGVDRVVVTNRSGSSILQGHSVYWLYREGDVWVAGQASLHYDRWIPPEVLFLPGGTQDTRHIDYVPDLHHADVKLGWWRPGEERPAWP